MMGGLKKIDGEWDLELPCVDDNLKDRCREISCHMKTWNSSVMSGHHHDSDVCLIIKFVVNFKQATA